MIIIKPNRGPKKVTSPTAPPPAHQNTKPYNNNTNPMVPPASQTFLPFAAGATLPRGAFGTITLSLLFNSPSTVKHMINTYKGKYEETVAQLSEPKVINNILTEVPDKTKPATVLYAYHMLAYLTYGLGHKHFQGIHNRTREMIYEESILQRLSAELVGTLSITALTSPGHPGHGVVRIIPLHAIYALAYHEVKNRKTHTV